MKLRTLVTLVAVGSCLAWAGSALARNMHCAGGIQYVVQGLKDKDRGNTEDYQREMNKAVQQLTMCAEEDPADFEALGYLGWALAEVDSFGPAGQAFEKALAGADAKGDKKKADVISANRDHYWSMSYNKGIQQIQDAQTLAEAEEKDQAHAAFAKAIDALTDASLLRPGNPQTIRNLATAYALDGDFVNAENVLTHGLTLAPKDSTLEDALRTVRANKANQLLDEKKYDEAVAYYGELTKAEPNNADLWMGLGNAYFKRAQEGGKEDTKKPDYKASGDAYAQAYKQRPDDQNLVFNAALAYQYAGDLAQAEAMWRAVLAKSPDDPDALSSLGSVLADEKKFDDATQVLLKAISIKPEEKVYFRQLGAVYSKAGNNAKSTEMLIYYMALNKGAPVASVKDAVASAKAGTPAANTLSSMGSPEKVLAWENTDTGGTLQTWVYGAKGLAFTFNAAGQLVTKSDWSVAKK